MNIGYIACKSDMLKVRLTILTLASHIEFSTVCMYDNQHIITYYGKVSLKISLRKFHVKSENGEEAKSVLNFFKEALSEN